MVRTHNTMLRVRDVIATHIMSMGTIKLACPMQYCLLTNKQKPSVVTNTTQAVHPGY